MRLNSMYTVYYAQEVQFEYVFIESSSKAYKYCRF